MLSITEREALAARDARYLALPLQRGSDPGSMAAHLREVVRRLRGGSCRAAVTYLTGLYDRSIAPRDDLACVRGCAFCCAQTVVVTAAEAFAVAAEIRARALTVAGLSDHPRRLGAPRSEWRPCPLLADDKACSVYDARPLACHGFVSLDLNVCIDFFAGSRNDSGLTPSDRQQMLTLCRMMLCAAHILTGHGAQAGYELTGAVAAILALPEPDAEARWHRGENVLKDVPMGPPVPPQFAEEIRRMAAFVAPTI
jgi:hypothetical protein